MKKKTTRKKKNVDVRICPKDKKYGMHCFHSDNEGNYGNSMSYPPPRYDTHCCKCGMDELDMHGPYHPIKKRTNNSNSNNVIYVNGVPYPVATPGGNTAVPGNSIINNTTTAYEKHPVTFTAGDCGCNKPIVIKKPKTNVTDTLSS